MKGPIYVSGPMTGMLELNFPAFNAAAQRLRALGFEVVNPAELNPDPAAKWVDCMRQDIKALCDCQAVATLPGWERSKGASLEVLIAERLGMAVMPLEAWLSAEGQAQAQIIGAAA